VHGLVEDKQKKESVWYRGSRKAAEGAVVGMTTTMATAAEENRSATPNELTRGAAVGAFTALTGELVVDELEAAAKKLPKLASQGASSAADAAGHLKSTTDEVLGNVKENLSHSQGACEALAKAFGQPRVDDKEKKQDVPSFIDSSGGSSCGFSTIKGVFGDNAEPNTGSRGANFSPSSVDLAGIFDEKSTKTYAFPEQGGDQCSVFEFSGENCGNNESCEKVFQNTLYTMFQQNENNGIEFDNCFCLGIIIFSIAYDFLPSLCVQFPRLKNQINKLPLSLRKFLLKDYYESLHI
jgi:hypothetical protein